jgi:methyltransferase
VLPSLPVASLVVGAVLLLMLVELQLSAHNEKALRAKGAVEPPDDVFATMGVVYPVAFVVMGIEAALGGPLARTTTLLGLVLFGWAKALKFWAVAHLGSRWTFRVLVPPDSTLVTTGPYRFLRHPNYVAVIGEFVAVMVALQAWASGAIATAVFVSLIRRRIAVEERALAAGTQEHRNTGA